jgi:hypothetical protein
MTTKTLTSLPLFLLMFASGCHNQLPPSRYIFLPDISASIYPESVEDEFGAMDRLVDHLHRGDQLVIIPIAGNARTDVQGHIVRLQVPEQRTAFDSDLGPFREEAHQEIARLRNWAISHPSARTDILGTLQVAQQEGAGGEEGNTKLIVLSDFIEDDGKWSFLRDQDVGSVAPALRLADSTRCHVKLQFSSIFLGHVRSRDSEALSTSRWDAVEAFWGELLKLPNQQIAIHTDGIGSLTANVEDSDPIAH